MKKILVLFGGHSFEHNISIRSCKTIISNISKEKYLVSLCGIGKDGNFEEDGKRYIIWGANFWEGMNLGAKNTGNRTRLMNDLDKMKSMGINNLRIIAASEGPISIQKPKIVLMPEPGVYNEDMFEGLDYVLYQLKKRGMKAVMVLNNFWHWSGGFAQYVSWFKKTNIPFPPGYLSGE